MQTITLTYYVGKTLENAIKKCCKKHIIYVKLYVKVFDVDKTANIK